MTTLFVSDLMTSAVEVIFEDEQIDVARTIMTLSRIRHLPVTDREDRLVGLISQRDLLARVVAQGAESSMLARDIMTGKVATVSPSTSIQMAARIMVDNKYGCLVATEHDRVVGILTESDFVQFVADNAERWE